MTRSLLKQIKNYRTQRKFNTIWIFDIKESLSIFLKWKIVLELCLFLNSYLLETLTKVFTDEVMDGRDLLSNDLTGGQGMWQAVE